jgi:hypothetical protein
LLHLVGINSVECMKMHGLTNPKFKMIYYVISELFMTVKIRIALFHVVITCTLVYGYRLLEEAYGTIIEDRIH